MVRAKNLHHLADHLPKTPKHWELWYHSLLRLCRALDINGRTDFGLFSSLKGLSDDLLGVCGLGVEFLYGLGVLDPPNYPQILGGSEGLSK